MSLDELGMGAAIARIPQFLSVPDEEGGHLERLFPVAPREVLVVGRTVAAHATEFVNAALGPALGVPLSFAVSSRLPSRVGAEAVVVAVALAPADEDVLRAARAAAARGARVFVLSNDAAPPLEDNPARIGRRVVPDVPRERLAIYSVVAETLRILELAQVAHDVAAMLDAAADRARARIEGPFAYLTFGEEYARRLGRTFPLLVGAPGVGLAAARWWGVEMAANARVLGFAESTGEYRDALLAGFGQSGDVTRQVATLVLLRCASDPPGAATVFAAIEDWLSEAVAGILTIEASGPSQLAQLIDLAVLAELTSVSLAAIEGIDPGPAPVIDGQE